MTVQLTAAYPTTYVCDRPDDRPDVDLGVGTTTTHIVRLPGGQLVEVEVNCYPYRDGIVVEVDSPTQLPVRVYANDAQLLDTYPEAG